MQYILASHNQNKVHEIKKILNVNILSLEDIGYSQEIIEGGKSFYENAKIKADTIAKLYPESIIIADDSGLVVPAMSGMPGIYSARFGKDKIGYNENKDLTNNKYLLQRMNGIKDRSAYYITCIVVVCKKSKIDQTFYGQLDGQITNEIVVGSGFGYDSVFKVKDTVISQMSQEKKNKISHRFIALDKLKESEILEL